MLVVIIIKVEKPSPYSVKALTDVMNSPENYPIKRCLESFKRRGIKPSKGAK